MKFATRATTTTPEGLRSVPTMDRSSSFKLSASIPNRETRFSRELTKSDRESIGSFLNCGDEKSLPFRTTENLQLKRFI